MNRIQHVHMPKGARIAFVSFRCAEAWRHELNQWLAAHNVTMQDLCIAAIAKLTGIKHPEN